MLNSSTNVIYELLIICHPFNIMKAYLKQRKSQQPRFVTEDRFKKINGVPKLLKK